MIKQLSKLSFLAVAMILLSGCPYSTDLEMDGAEKVNNAYLGTFEKQSSSYYYAVISKKSENEYKIEKFRTKDDELRETGTGWIYDIKGTKFLYVKRESSSSSSYYYKRKGYLYKFMPSKSGYIMKLQGVSDYISEEFESAAELKNYLEKYKDLSFFYQTKIDKYYKADEE